MDYEFRQNEMANDPEDARHAQWLKKVGALLNREILPGSELESDLFDYYSDGADPEDAAEEVRAIEQMQRNVSPGTCRDVLDYFSDKRLRLVRDEKLNRMVWSLHGTTHQQITEAGHLDHWSLFNWIAQGRAFLEASK